MLLKEGVEMIPQLGYPVKHPKQLFLVGIDVTVRLYQLPPQVTDQEAIGWLYIVGEGQHPAARNGENGVRLAMRTLSVVIPCLPPTDAHWISSQVIAGSTELRAVALGR